MYTCKYSHWIKMTICMCAPSQPEFLCIHVWMYVVGTLNTMPSPPQRASWQGVLLPVSVSHCLCINKIMLLLCWSQCLVFVLLNKSQYLLNKKCIIVLFCCCIILLFCCIYIYIYIYENAYVPGREQWLTVPASFPCHSHSGFESADLCGEKLLSVPHGFSTMTVAKASHLLQERE
jgi:hypothetical protein